MAAFMPDQIYSLYLQSSRWHLLVVFVLYLGLVRLLRYRRAEHRSIKRSIPCASSYHAMTADQAQSIMKDLVELKFPKLMGFSIIFALFKTYGIPSVSSLLIKTGELSTPEGASRRIADTGVLILEFSLNAPSSERAMEAIARMNFLHSAYLEAGKISNDDMLYTLGVFALEPVRWVDEFEWRRFTELERCAVGTFWKTIGDKMEIDMSVLPGSNEGWRDGFEWLYAIRGCSDKYEEKMMVPAEVNHQLVMANLEVVFHNLPASLREFGGYIVSTAAGPRLRHAMMLANPPRRFEVTLLGLIHLRKYFLRYLMLPRVIRKNYLSDRPQFNGRYSAKEYLSHPWYVMPTLKRRWAPKAWLTCLAHETQITRR